MSYDQRINRCWRSAMRAWAKRWRVIHRDARERSEADYCLRQALRCRGSSRNEKPL